MSMELIDLHPAVADFQQEVVQGLQRSAKGIPPKFLYDQKGSQLFDAICRLDEYYLTRSEIQILEDYSHDIATLIADSVLIEFGSGSCQKIPILLKDLPHLDAYIALDISKDHLQESCITLEKQFPQVRIVGICVDYSQPLELPGSLALQNCHKVGFFPGSSIGNFAPEEAITFLKNAAIFLQSGGLLVGVDLKKDPAILIPAYDDAQGVSADFALNVLVRMNRELGANIEVENFRYRVRYDSDTGCVEMGMVSLIDQVVQIRGHKIRFEAGEFLHTESSYKYSVEEFQNLALAAGFQPKCVWTDPAQQFSLHYLCLS